jgi:hypothetical protein
MARETVKTYQNVLESVRAFNKGLELSKRLREQIHFFQSWYYIPELDAVGPYKKPYRIGWTCSRTGPE